MLAIVFQWITLHSFTVELETGSHSTYLHLFKQKLSQGASLNPSIVNTWALKKGPFTSKLWSGFTERFYNSAQLTLAGVAGLAMENLQSAQFAGDQSKRRVSLKLEISAKMKVRGL